MAKTRFKQLDPTSYLSTARTQPTTDGNSKAKTRSERIRELYRNGANINLILWSIWGITAEPPEFQPDRAINAVDQWHEKRNACVRFVLQVLESEQDNGTSS
jgi:hypothetical protein